MDPHWPQGVADSTAASPEQHTDPHWPQKLRANLQASKKTLSPKKISQDKINMFENRISPPANNKHKKIPPKNCNQPPGRPTRWKEMGRDSDGKMTLLTVTDNGLRRSKRKETIRPSRVKKNNYI